MGGPWSFLGAFVLGTGGKGFGILLIFFLTIINLQLDCIQIHGMDFGGSPQDP